MNRIMSRGHLANTSQLNLILLYEPSAFRWGKLYFYTSVNMNIFEQTDLLADDCCDGGGEVVGKLHPLFSLKMLDNFFV